MNNYEVKGVAFSDKHPENYVTAVPCSSMKHFCIFQLVFLVSEQMNCSVKSCCSHSINFTEYSSQNPTVHYLLLTKGQTDTVSNYLVNIVEHSAAKEPKRLTTELKEY